MLPAAALLDKRQPHNTNQQDKEAAIKEHSNPGFNFRGNVVELRGIRATDARSTGNDGHGRLTARSVREECRHRGSDGGHAGRRGPPEAAPDPRLPHLTHPITSTEIPDKDTIMTLSFPGMCSLPVPTAPARAEIDVKRFSNRRDTPALLSAGSIAARRDLRAEVAA